MKSRQPQTGAYDNIHTIRIPKNEPGALAIIVGMWHHGDRSFQQKYDAMQDTTSHVGFSPRSAISGSLLIAVAATMFPLLPTERERAVLYTVFGIAYFFGLSYFGKYTPKGRLCSVTFYLTVTANLFLFRAFPIAAPFISWAFSMVMTSLYARELYERTLAAQTNEQSA